MMPAKAITARFPAGLQTRSRDLAPDVVLWNGQSVVVINCKS